jgi:hypothetical protein
LPAVLILNYASIRLMGTCHLVEEDSIPST